MSLFTTQAATPAYSFTSLGKDLLAGGLTAGIFYAEYTGLGAALGSVLPGKSGPALGIVMVIAAVIFTSMLALCLRQRVIAGTRAASLAVVIVGMRFASENATDISHRFDVAMAALATMLVIASATQLLGLLPRVQNFIYGSHIALRKGFIFATAVGIVVGLASTQLHSCLQVSPVATLFVVTLSTAGAVAWSYWCTNTRASPGAWRKSLGSFSMLLGTGMAVAGYYLWVVDYAAGGACGTLGSVGLQPSQLTQLIVSPQRLTIASAGLPVWAWLVLVAIGVLLGTVLLLETLTTLRDSDDKIPKQEWSSQIKMRALANLVSAPLGLACTSLSQSRTNTLVAANGATRAAVFFHGVALASIFLFLSTWIAKVPHLAVAVALLLVAIQMIDSELRDTVWREGYAPEARGTSIHTTWIFWAILVCSLMAGTWLRYLGWGFGGGPLIALVLGALLIALVSRRHDHELTVQARQA